MTQNITLIEAGLFTEHSYSDFGAGIASTLTLNGWQELILDQAIYNNFQGGYYARAFVQVEGGVATNLVIAHRGTELLADLGADLLTNGELSLGGLASQEIAAQGFKIDVEAAFNAAGYNQDAVFNEVTTNVGHSLGGYLAINLAHTMGSKAIAFDNPKSGIVGGTSADILNVLNPENLINTAGAGSHLGTVLRLPAEYNYETNIQGASLVNLVAKSVMQLNIAPENNSGFLNRIYETVLDLGTETYILKQQVEQTLVHHAMSSMLERLGTEYLDVASNYNRTPEEVMKFYLIGEFETNGELGGIARMLWDAALFTNPEGCTISDFGNAILATINAPDFDYATQEQYWFNGSDADDDYITANAEVNFISAFGGDDIIVASGNNDIIDGGNGNDAVDYSAINQGVSVDLSAGNTYLASQISIGGLPVGQPKDILLNIENIGGTAYSDTILGNVDDNVLVGMGGNDDLDGSAGNDLIFGGAGNDILYGSTGADELYGEVGDDNLIGGSGDDVLDGGSGTNMLEGGIGNDTYILPLSGSGFSTVNDTGLGDLTSFETDTLSDIGGVFVGSGGVYDLGLATLTLSGSTLNISGAVQAAILNFQNGDYGITLIDNSNIYTGVETVDGGAGNPPEPAPIVTLSGSENSDIITGSSRNDAINGLGGHDYITAGAYAGILTINGGTGHDTIDGSASPQMVAYGGAGNDVLAGGMDATLYGEGDHDRLQGGKQQYAGSGNDRLTPDGYTTVADGGTGEDTIDLSEIFVSGGSYTVGGNAGSVSVVNVEHAIGSDFNDTLTGDGGGNLLDGGAGNNDLSGAGGADTLIGGYQNDVLDGGIGDDTLIGGAGSDTFNDNAGNDAYWGNIGGDLFSFLSGSGYDVIHDFDGEEGDVIDLTTLLPTSLSLKELIAQHVTEDNGDLLLTFNSGARTILLKGVTLDDLEYSHFIGLPDAPTQGGDNFTAARSTNYDGEGGNDTITGSGEADTLAGGAGNDTLNGGAGNDYLNGGTEENHYFWAAGDGNDTLIEAGAGNLNDNDVLHMSGGIMATDVEIYGDNDDMIIEYMPTGEFITISGRFLNDNHMIEMLAFDDGTTIDLTVYNVSSNAGDTVLGTVSADTLSGGYGNDTIEGDAGNDFINGNKDDDSIDGGAGDDVLHGGQQNDTIEGGVGNDSLYGDNGIDLLYGEDGNDYLDGGSGNDKLVGGLGADTLIGGLGDDVIDAHFFDTGTGGDYIDAGAGNDYVLAGRGADTLIGGDGDRDTLTFHGADDNLVLDFAQNIFTGDAINGDNFIGFERFFAGNHDDLMVANDEASWFNGLAGNDTLHGGTGNDYLIGGDGNDVITGNAGADTLHGGAGNDVFTFNSSDSTAAARDIIVGFIQGEDLIDVTAAGISDLSGLIVNGYGTHTIATDTNSDFSLQLQGVGYTLTESDFIMAA